MFFEREGNYEMVDEPTRKPPGKKSSDVKCHRSLFFLLITFSIFVDVFLGFVCFLLMFVERKGNHEIMDEPTRQPSGQKLSDMANIKCERSGLFPLITFSIF